MKISIAADHRGYKLKEKLKAFLKEKNIEVKDFGTDSEESVDYPFYAKKVAESVAAGESGYGILICGSGIGVDIVANKVKGVRSVNALNTELAAMSRKHNNANVISLASDFIDEETAKEAVDIFLNTEFEGGRHQRRIDQIDELTGL
jgi:ribose 5-phosphate isomerase B